MKKVKPFEPQEKGYMVIDNTVLDYIMPRLSPNAWKCLCLIMRKTKGWNKIWDGLSYSQIKEGTGIRSDPTVQRAVAELLRGRYIRQVKGDKWDATQYALNTTLEIEVENGTTTETKVDTTTETKVDTTTETKVDTAIESKDTILQDTQERQLPQSGETTGLIDERADTRSETDLPKGRTQAPVLFGGRIDDGGFPPEQVAETQRLLEMQWGNLRGKNIKTACVYLLLATGWGLPPPGARKRWNRELRQHITELEFPVKDLPSYYAAAWQRLRNGTGKNGQPLTLRPYPGTLTATMEAIREERKRNAQQQQKTEWEWR